MVWLTWYKLTSSVENPLVEVKSQGICIKSFHEEYIYHRYNLGQYLKKPEPYEP